VGEFFKVKHVRHEYLRGEGLSSRNEVLDRIKMEGRKKGQRLGNGRTCVF